jgi:hypothetical protein
VQAAFARVRRAHAEGTVVSPRALLFQTARNLALNQIRHRSYTHPIALTETDLSGVLDDGIGVPEAVAQAEDEPGTVAAEDPGKCHAILEGVEEAAVGEAEMLTVDHAEGPGSGKGLGHPLLRPARARRRLTVGEVHDADAVPLRGQQRQRAAATDLDVVGMGADRDHVER